MRGHLCKTSRRDRWATEGMKGERGIVEGVSGVKDGRSGSRREYGDKLTLRTFEDTKRKPTTTVETS